MIIETKTVKLSEIYLNPANPRKISPVAMDRLVKSLTDFPEMMQLREIVVDENMTILGGNMRFMALKKSGAKHAIAKIVSSLTPEQKREFIVKDNAAFGEWNFPELEANWSDLPLEDWGIELPESGDCGLPDEPKDAEPQIDKAAELNKTWQVNTGDLWVIGKHRLLCGDSTKKQDVIKLLNGAIPFLCVTDPPYGVEYDAGWRKKIKGEEHYEYALGKVTNDDRADWQQSWELFPGDVIYSYCPQGELNIIHGKALQDAGFELRTQIIWAKNRFPMGRGDYHLKHEPCWYAVRKGKSSKFVDDRTQTTLWEIDKPQKSETGHSTQKPIECMARPIRNHHANEVYDPFLGSGTTMVACENLGRKCFGIEISPEYCAVILQRMQDAHGITGIR